MERRFLLSPSLCGVPGIVLPGTPQQAAIFRLTLSFHRGTQNAI